ncbi:NADH:ubiquinone oxidoreductase subunit NDUFA12 [Sphingomonas solaris]|uniref:NADH:ubiquinone oxidoreductase subunit NDUFA12 n=1 Tax=Alterirhizorhabdus solaris TaxID=2529389 RepID=A0A558R2T8_9SPHN|nr:NADH:ubiquinone oxidoreductase subunit NDUFA12 [Sphingomonas solaris]TVV73705.1 NADH:ubiquinone oxidoreductase subunit NDUFA12 [Sphingomonas solaris]
MGLLKNIFTWWDGATIGTSLFSRRNGREVGRDAAGNLYFEAKKEENGFRRRWVMYNGANDASRVPPEWHGWLHNTVDALPDQSLPPARVWEKPALPNQTGTATAYRPAGALEKGGRRAAATGDYEAWSPDAL